MRQSTASVRCLCLKMMRTKTNDNASKQVYKKTKTTTTTETQTTILTRNIFDNIIKELQLNNCIRRLDDKNKHPITLVSSWGTPHLLDSIIKPNNTREITVYMGAWDGMTKRCGYLHFTFPFSTQLLEKGPKTM